MTGFGPDVDAPVSAAVSPVALLPTSLIQDEFASRKLVRAINLLMESPERYYLVWPSARTKYPSLAALRGWLVAKTAPDR